MGEKEDEMQNKIACEKLVMVRGRDWLKQLEEEIARRTQKSARANGCRLAVGSKERPASAVASAVSCLSVVAVASEASELRSLMAGGKRCRVALIHIHANFTAVGDFLQAAG